MRIYKIAKLSGEWWIIDGSAIFADGDAGDFSHETYSIKYAQDMLMDDPDGDWESWKMQKAIATAESIKAENEFEDNYDEYKYWEMSQEAKNDPEVFLLDHMEEAGIDQETFFVANGNHKDPRDWSMKTLGWKRVEGNNITTWTLTSDDLTSIKQGIWDIAQENDILDDEEFNIEVRGNNTMYWAVPFSIIESSKANELMGYRSKSQWGPVAKNKMIRIYRLAGGGLPTYCAWCKSFMSGEDVGYEHKESSHGLCEKCKEAIFDKWIKKDEKLV